MIAQVIPNIIGLTLTMAMPPFFIACIYAVQSNIYPMHSHSLVRLVLEAGARVLVVVCLFCGLVGYGIFHVAELSGDESRRAYGLGFMAVSGSLVATVTAGIVMSLIHAYGGGLARCIRRVLPS